MGYDLPENPITRRIEATGYPFDYEEASCPVCGHECSTLYIKDGEVLGCDECVDILYYDEESYYCQECGEMMPEVGYAKDGEILGCEKCIKEKDYWEYMEDHKYD